MDQIQRRNHPMATCGLSAGSVSREHVNCCSWVCLWPGVDFTVRRRGDISLLTQVSYVSKVLFLHFFEKEGQGYYLYIYLF